MPTLQGPLADVLARRRDVLNAKFVAARHASPRIGGESFLEHLATTVDPIVRAVHGAFAERVEGVTVALFDLSLELFGLGLLGRDARQPALLDAWRRLFPAIPRLLAREPARVAGAACNAVHQLATTAGARPAQWIDEMTRLGAACETTAEFLEAGKVVAWRCGMAHYRDGALAAARTLPPALAARALGLPPDVTQAALTGAIDRLARDPWLDPSNAVAPPNPKPSPRVVARVGAFRGFGGPFLRPPTVSAAGRDLLATDGDGTWLVRADRFGAVFLRTDPAATPNAPSRPTASARLGPDGTVAWPGAAGTATARIADAAGATSSASDGTTLAVTTPTSHEILLVAVG